MGRATVRKVFVTGLVVSVVGFVIMLLTSSGGQISHHTIYTGGTMLAAIGGVIVLVSWIMALVASAMFGRWGWFVVMLILGLIGLVPIVMIFYSLFGPSQRRELRPSMAA